MMSESQTFGNVSVKLSCHRDMTRGQGQYSLDTFSRLLLSYWRTSSADCISSVEILSRQRTDITTGLELLKYLY